MKEWRTKPRKTGKPLLRVWALREEYRNRCMFALAMKDISVITGNCRFGYLPVITGIAFDIAKKQSATVDRKADSRK